MWDELAAGLLAFPELITEARTIYIDMDASYGSRERGPKKKRIQKQKH